MEEKWGALIPLLVALLGFFGSDFSETFKAKAEEGPQVKGIGDFETLLSQVRLAMPRDEIGLQNKGVIAFLGPDLLVPEEIKTAFGSHYWLPSFFYESTSGKTTLLISFDGPNNDLTVALLLGPTSSLLNNLEEIKGVAEDLLV